MSDSKEGLFTEHVWSLRPASIQSLTLISTCRRGTQGTRAASAQVQRRSNRIIKCTHLLLRFLFIYFTRLCPDGEGSVASLSPAHTLSSVSWPGSVEALSPCSLQVSTCCLFSVLFKLCTFDF